MFTRLNELEERVLKGSEDGQTLVESALVVVLVALLVIAAVAWLGGSIGSTTSHTDHVLAAAATEAPGQGGVSVPGVPTGVTASGSASRGVVLAWRAPSSDGGSPLTAYELYRGRSPGAETPYATVACASPACTYRDIRTRRGATYFYEIAAENAVGSGAASAQASGTAT